MNRSDASSARALTRPLTGERPGGWQYTPQYANALWERRELAGAVGEYISHYQLLPPRTRVSELITYYIDGTLRYWFEEYGYPAGRRVKNSVLARERDAYTSSRFVICMSKWCADDVISSYDIDPGKVKTILPGPNLDEEGLPAPAPWNGEHSPLRLGLIGLNWELKGGSIIFDAAVALQRVGYDVEVVVMGPDPGEVPDFPSVRRLGYINKRTDLSRFVDVVRSLHFGCLLSRIEASGMSSLEYLRLGIPIVVTPVGGIIDPKDAGLRIPVEADGEFVADALDAVLRDPRRYAKMRAAAAREGTFHSWDRSAREMLELLERAAPGTPAVAAQ